MMYVWLQLSCVTHVMMVQLVPQPTGFHCYLLSYQRLTLATCCAKNLTGLSQYDDSTESQLLYYNNIRFNTAPK